MVEKTDSYQYGIGKYEILNSTERIPDWALASFGGSVAVLESGEGKTSIREILQEYIPVTVSGILPSMALGNVNATFHDVLFTNRDIGLYLTNNDCQIKPPMKPSSTFKQILNNLNNCKNIEFQTNIIPKTTTRKIIISELNTNVICSSIPFSYVCFVEKVRTISDVYTILTESLQKQIEYVVKCVKQLQMQPGDEIMLNRYFHPNSVLPIMIPTTSSTASMESYYKYMKNVLCLPNSRVLAEAGRCGLGIEPTVHSMLNVLTNVHDIVRPPDLPIVVTVKGRYGYYHYGQQGKNDTGWGCAYRSLQSCHSWFYLQGHTDTKPLNHGEIQKILVKIGDKQPSFIGSKEVIIFYKYLL